VLEITLDGVPLLIVNAQLDKMGGHPQLQFTVVAIAVPEAW
jgi:hypothetical protein